MIMTLRFNEYNFLLINIRSFLNLILMINYRFRGVTNEYFLMVHVALNVSLETLQKSLRCISNNMNDYVHILRYIFFKFYDF